jgi:hypothetical protein
MRLAWSTGREFLNNLQAGFNLLKTPPVFHKINVWPLLEEVAMQNLKVPSGNYWIWLKWK